MDWGTYRTFSQFWILEHRTVSSTELGKLELFQVMDLGTHRTFSQDWTGKPKEPFPELDWGNYRTFTQ